MTCIEILAHSIRKNENIQGLDIPGVGIKKINLLAVDTMLCIKALEESLGEMLHILAKFEEISGLKANPNKSIILRVGKNRDLGYKLQAG